MRKVALIGLMLISCAASLFGGYGKILKHQRPVANSYIVVMNSIDPQKLVGAVHRIAADYGVRLAHRPNDGEESIFRYAFQGFSGQMTEAAASAMASDPRVLTVEQDAFVSVSSTDTFSEGDPIWHLDRIDQTTQVCHPGDCPNGRSYSYYSTGSNVYIFVLDSGVERNHIEFDDDNDPNSPQSTPRVMDGKNFTYIDGINDSSPAYHPCGGLATGYVAGTHGTAVASAAAGKNVGVAKHAWIVPVKILSCDNNGTLQMMCWGMDWIAGPENSSKRPAVLNVSMWIDSVAPWDTVTPISSFENTVNNVVAAGITVVVSANNHSNSNCTESPARMGHGNYDPQSGDWWKATPYRTITVGGVDEYDRLWKCANFGDCNTGEPGSNTGPCVDIYAPAHNVKTALNATFGGYTTYDNYRTGSARNGTSFAAPIVAGVAARLLEQHWWWGPNDVWSFIQGQSPCLDGYNCTGSNASAFDVTFDNDTILINNRIVYINPNY